MNSKNSKKEQSPKPAVLALCDAGRFDGLLLPPVALMSPGRARKGPSAAERRAAQAADRERIAKMIWTVTEEQARVLRDAFEAGPEGLYVPCGNVGTVVARLVDGECGTYRTRTTKHTHVGSWAHKGDFELTEYYFVPNARGLAHIGISPWPGTPVACEGLSSDRPDGTAIAKVTQT